MTPTRLHALAATLLTLGAATTWAKPLTVCTEASPDGFDVVQYNSLTTTNASADVLFNRLVDYDAGAGKVVPSLAEKWEASADGLSYTFTLRRNVQFHSTDYFKPGRALNADDVVFTFERMLEANHPWYRSAPNGYPHAQSFQLGKIVKAVKKVDDYTVRFELSQPEATFVPLLTMGFASIYSAEYAAKLTPAKAAELNSKPIGTGPFILKSYQKDAVIRYDVNPAYFGAKPKADRLIYAITPDATVRVQKVKAGECQIALSPKPQDVLAARADKSVKVVDTHAFATAFIAFNSQHKPFDNAKVRQALNIAFDKQTYLKRVFDGTATAADGPYPPNTWSYVNLPDYSYDPAKAKQLLADAGFPNGFATTIWIRPSGSTLNPNPRAGGELLQADLARVGVKAELKVIEWGELIKRAKAGEHDILFMGWSGDNGDPDNFLTPQFACASVESGLNFARYCDANLDKAIATAKKTADQTARSKQYETAQKIIHDQALWIPLAHPVAAALTTPNVAGYKVNPFGRQDFSSVSVN
ncbi:dipeptide transport system substrate-binding protein [Andreprevotia lacus DSM 23236]|uniref:Dipeptide transport system substrate-binding protein n=1 Tax=Andreprevotia lacus DSM 23236 TaxID=1121001 RepID=A0A1W1XVU3_9NEIS|nr:ABC transporter substrate-binding protein [Andreprevotia lacus]SMC27975.1 dipeptide transport system substrate-binding protein [Andreprevotia lacus DSM 23236]